MRDRGFPQYQQTILRYQQGVQKFHSILMLSTQVIASDSTGKGLSPRRPPSTSDTSQKPRLFLPVFLADWILMGGSHSPLPLGSINLLKWLTELREIFYVIDQGFIIKGYNSGAARWERCVGQRTWEGARSFPALSRGTILRGPRGHHLRSSPNHVLLSFYGDFMT
ncbi:hypothetical protein mRhiFer1_010240 [Rhinolophus ferrumequinum]|uniref:Uncharacterized protein n=1 Tax=Rhinolophus ferrumequinum TaxID=59479 RepID=A0A7J7X5C6_RHIFE|nr:hypothetical protein mRhiFer1_010240 [Rhinolophus ferrumequinum]